ncbi:Sulfate transporter 4.1, chloroplastic [Hordeum vulgare]|nr:Sulfate transporter 4.1, chloroplastic [Hordeum vulgare]
MSSWTADKDQENAELRDRVALLHRALQETNARLCAVLEDNGSAFHFPCLSALVRGSAPVNGCLTKLLLLCLCVWWCGRRFSSARNGLTGADLQEGPSAAVLGRLPGTTVYRNTLQYPEADTYNGIIVVRVDAPIYFANITVTYIDSSVLQALKDLHQEYKARDIEVLTLKQIAIANPYRQVHLLLSRAGIIDMIGLGWCFVRVHDAVQVCLQHVQSS